MSTHSRLHCLAFATRQIEFQPYCSPHSTSMNDLRSDCHASMMACPTVSPHYFLPAMHCLCNDDLIAAKAVFISLFSKVLIANMPITNTYAVKIYIIRNGKAYSATTAVEGWRSQVHTSFRCNCNRAQCLLPKLYDNVN